MLPLVTVVIPTYRRDSLLEKCLNALAKQTLDHDLWEVFVVDDGAQESTRQLVELKRDECPTMNVHYLRRGEQKGPAAARNAGWRAGCGIFIAFTDDDCVPEPSWLQAGTAALLGGADAVSGRVIVPLPPRPTDYERSTAGLATAEFVTANCFVRRSALEQLNGFDEAYRVAWREDSDLHFRLLSHRKAIARSEMASVVHPVRPGSWGISLRQEQKHRYDGLLQAKFPTLYRTHLAPYPDWYYLHAAALVGALFTFIPSLRSLGWFSLSIWLLSTVYFAVCRLRGNSRSLSHIVEMLVTSAVLPVVSLYWHWIGIWEHSHVGRLESSPTWASSLRSPNTSDEGSPSLPAPSAPLF